MKNRIANEFFLFFLRPIEISLRRREIPFKQRDLSFFIMILRYKNIDELC